MNAGAAFILGVSIVIAMALNSGERYVSSKMSTDATKQFYASIAPSRYFQPEKTECDVGTFSGYDREWLVQTKCDAIRICKPTKDKDDMSCSEWKYGSKPESAAEASRSAAQVQK